MKEERQGGDADLHDTRSEPIPGACGVPQDFTIAYLHGIPPHRVGVRFRLDFGRESTNASSFVNPFRLATASIRD
jgi:hypothetical protein